MTAKLLCLTFCDSEIRYCVWMNRFLTFLVNVAFYVDPVLFFREGHSTDSFSHLPNAFHLTFLKHRPPDVVVAPIHISALYGLNLQHWQEIIWDWTGWDGMG